MKNVKTKNVIVGGNKIITVEAKAEEGKFTDKFGNTIYITDSPENMERLQSLKPKRAKKKVVKKAEKKPAKRAATRKKATKKK